MKLVELKADPQDPDVAARQMAAYRLLERLLTPHPSEEVVGWIPIAGAGAGAPATPTSCCPYEPAYHVDNQCPQELGPFGARYAAGDA